MARDDEELMRYLDGDLSPSEARQLERRGVDEAMAGSLGQVQGVVRAHYAAHEADAGARLDAMWGQLSKQLAKPLDTAPAPSGFWTRLRDWFDAYRGHVMTGAICAAAGALIAILAVRHAQPSLQAARGPEVETLDVTDGTGTIFKVQSDHGPSTVIWVTHDEVATPAPTSNQTGSGPEGPI